MHPSLRLLLILATATTVSTFALLCRDAAPQLDDYMIAAHVDEDGLWSAQVGWYRHWHGKYSGMLAMSVFAWAFDIVERYWLAPALILAATWAALFTLTRSVAPERRPAATLALAVLLLALYVSQIPEPQEAIYWMTGAYAYQAGIVCALFLLSLIIAGRRGIGSAIVGVLLAFGLAGSSETLMLPSATLAGVWMLAAVARRVRHTLFGWAVTGALLTGGAAMVLAPGNAVRSTHFDGPTHLLKRTLGRALEEGAEHLALFALSPAMIGAGLLFAGPLCALAKRWRPRVGGLHFVLWYLLLAATFVPAFWATGYGPPPRAMAPVWAVFALGNLFVLVPLVARFANARGVSLSVKTRKNIGAALLAVGMIWPANTLVALTDVVSGRSRAFANEVLQRDRAIRAAAAAGIADVTIEALETRPVTLFVGDLDANPQHGLNVQAASFFKVRSLTTR